jgi:hypothetical protein
VRSSVRVLIADLNTAPVGEVAPRYSFSSSARSCASRSGVTCEEG